jgi:lactate permease
LGPTLPDILSAIVSITCLIALLRFWRPKAVWRFPGERTAEESHAVRGAHTTGELIRAWAPFLLLIIFVGNWGVASIQHVLGLFTVLIPFGILNNAIIGVSGVPIAINYSFAWLGAAGTAILFAAILSALLLRISWNEFWGTAAYTFKELFRPLVTIASIVGFAYVANYSGMSATIGTALTVTGPFFPFLSPLLGWFGVFVTGSDTSSNALFSNIQSQTAHSLGMNPVLTVSANSSGGVAAKMISPQSIAIATAATKLPGQEGTLFRFTILHSLGIVFIICVITYLQAYYLQWMVPEATASVTSAVVATGLGAADILLIGASFVAVVGLILFSRHSCERGSVVSQ